MKISSLSETNFELWLSMGGAHHSLMLVRQRELRPYNITIHQLNVLRNIKDLGSGATLPAVAKRVEREPHAMSKQSARMEKDGLIKRIKNTPKSNLLKLELTEKGLDLTKLARQSKSIDIIFSVLSGEERRQMISMLRKIAIKAKKLTSSNY